MSYRFGFCGTSMRIASCVCFCLSFVASGCGGYGPSEYEQYKQKLQGFSEAVAAAGGSASKEGKTMHGFQMTGWLIDLSGAEITDDLIDQIIFVGKEDPVFQLNLSKSKITDEQLGKLDAGTVFTKVYDLDLSDTAITDAGLDKIQHVHILSELKLKRSGATAAGVKRLSERKIASPQTPQQFKQPPKTDL